MFPISQYINSNNNIYHASNPKEGYFGKIVEPAYPPYLRWYFCRDMFRSAQPKASTFFYYSSKKNIKHITAFIHAIEARLKLSRRSLIEETDTPKIYRIKMCGFWCSKVRKSLFTALLRSGKHYRGDINAVIEKSKYLRRTEKAFKLFLKGHTKTVFKAQGPRFGGRRFYGWVHWTEGISTKTLKEMLVKP